MDTYTLGDNAKQHLQEKPPALFSRLQHYSIAFHHRIAHAPWYLRVTLHIIDLLSRDVVISQAYVTCQYGADKVGYVVAVAYAFSIIGAFSSDKLVALWGKIPVFTSSKYWYHMDTLISCLTYIIMQKQSIGSILSYYYSCFRFLYIFRSFDNHAFMETYSSNPSPAYGIPTSVVMGLVRRYSLYSMQW